MAHEALRIRKTSAGVKLSPISQTIMSTDISSFHPDIPCHILILPTIELLRTLPWFSSIS